MQRIAVIQAETSVPLFVQCVDFVTPPDSPRKRYYSSIAMIEGSGATSGVYHKNVLMPLTEFLPFESTFPSLRRLLPNTRTVLRGEAGEPIAGPGGRFAPLICYEILFPKYVREMVRHGCGYMVNLTNDLWYGRRQQPVQHLVFARLRAIENRKPVIRATNSGISALIDERGVTGDGRQTRAVERTVLRGRVIPREGTTFYCRHGDLLHRFILPVLAALAFGLAWRRGVRRQAARR
jgi:apolipoprotein N-acyltransferase